MSHKVNLVRVLTAATGNSSPIQLDAAYSQLFMTPAEAGAMNGRVYSYLIVDGNNWEYGRGVYTSSGTSLARGVIASRIGGTLGASRINLSGTAQVRFIELAEDMDGVRGTRAVIGTSDTLVNSDQGYVVTYSNASAIAVSLAQAGSSGLFLDGWATTARNKGVGTVTITVATSTIAGNPTLQLKQYQSAFIWSDGTNYDYLIFRGDLGTAAVRADTDFIRTDTAQSLNTTQQAAARANAGLLDTVPTITRYLTGSGAYTTPAGVKWIKVTMVGGGGGGGPGGTGGTSANGGNTTFGALVAGGGGAGSGSGTSVGLGGTNSGSLGTDVVNLPGQTGGGYVQTLAAGDRVGGVGGGSALFGGGGQLALAAGGGQNGNAGLANTGGGGSGGGTATSGVGLGGGGGGSRVVIVGAPSSTYSYAVGAGGAVTSGSISSGGAGGSGQIIVEEHYNF